ncbi:hypothetical protein CLOBOL_02096 [Enterocloster bolteae ATCC BAA-613]|uniref:Uncharacterized protein n=1 Tax=Enterocloster bolteae (strain ATCC BAA-613 / DSM 15670 / CCUG 46953 / JCM 12243 / WAL 16351) TaxID=411902 RepID=A8RN46_ENTBW|nr:hypothetical protein CLOBOL_02096 [Enterocloster bolteae ATCC BAA-613]
MRAAAGDPGWGSKRSCAHDGLARAGCNRLPGSGEVCRIGA